MKKFTILSCCSILFIVGCLFYTGINWRILSQAEGWGVVGMVGLISFGIAGLIIDYVLRKLIKNKWILNIIELIIVFFFSIELWITNNPA